MYKLLLKDGRYITAKVVRVVGGAAFCSNEGDDHYFFIAAPGCWENVTYVA